MNNLPVTHDPNYTDEDALYIVEELLLRADLTEDAGDFEDFYVCQHEFRGEVVTQVTSRTHSGRTYIDYFDRTLTLL